MVAEGALEVAAVVGSVVVGKTVEACEVAVAKGLPEVVAVLAGADCDERRRAALGARRRRGAPSTGSRAIRR
jgi:CO/xanthine dehydrogenase Mo-binding subunit